MPRIGGAFPLGQGPFPVILPSGGEFYPPAGQYLFILGANTRLEAWDGSAAQWRTALPASQAGFYSVDGFNFRLLNFTGISQTPAITAVGSGATNGIGQVPTGVTAAISAPGANGRQATAFPIVGGSINTTVSFSAGTGNGLGSAGSGLIAPPLLIVQPPPVGGITATMTCTISAGAVNGVTVTNVGAGYLTAPLVMVIPQLATYAGQVPPTPGVQGVVGSNLPLPVVGPITFPNNGVFTTLPVLSVNATLTGSGTLTGLVMLDNGTLYTGTPTFTITGAGAATATLAATVTAGPDTSFLQPAVGD